VTIFRKEAMHFNQSIVGAALCLSLAAASQAQTTSEAPAADTAVPVAPVAAATKGQLPKLVIKWQCKEACTANDKVPPLIEQAYAKAVAGGGYTLSDSETAEVTIVDFRQRPPGVRLGLGFLAGKDRLGVSISYRGKEMTASDYSASTVQGMNSLSESVGKKSYQELVALVTSGGK
jgi:hypothetical protein